MKKLLLFTVLLSTSFALFCPAILRVQPVTQRPIIGLPITQQTTTTTTTTLKDKLLTDALQKIMATLNGPDTIDEKIGQYKELINQLKTTKIISLSPLKQTAIRETLNALLQELDSLIGENEYWLYDTQQTSTLKECRAEVASLVTKFSGYWYGLPTQMYSYYKTHWRAPFKIAAIVLPLIYGYNKLAPQ